MKRAQKIISMALLFAFLLNTCAYDLSFASTLRSDANVDNLSTPKMLSNITGDLDTNRVEMAFKAMLELLKKEVNNLTPDMYEGKLREIYKTRIAKAIDEAGNALKVKVFFNTTPRINEPGAWFRCWTLNDKGIRKATYYVNLAPNGADADIKAYTEQDFNSKSSVIRASASGAAEQVTEDIIKILSRSNVLYRKLHDSSYFTKRDFKDAVEDANTSKEKLELSKATDLNPTSMLNTAIKEGLIVQRSYKFVDKMFFYKYVDGEFRRKDHNVYISDEYKDRFFVLTEKGTKAIEYLESDEARNIAAEAAKKNGAGINADTFDILEPYFKSKRASKWSSSTPNSKGVYKVISRDSTESNRGAYEIQLKSKGDLTLLFSNGSWRWPNAGYIKFSGTDTRVSARDETSTPNRNLSYKGNPLLYIAVNKAGKLFLVVKDDFYDKYKAIRALDERAGLSPLNAIEHNIIGLIGEKEAATLTKIESTATMTKVTQENDP
ncbi:MAG: hypothetical protein Q7S30_03525, partial [Candidatus Omnitrophota bacterium]|nr:hypothetical protein [Candidatus Omnitrophota bacterium]